MAPVMSVPPREKVLIEPSGKRAVEAGDHGAVDPGKPAADRLLRLLGVEATLGVEVDDLGRIHVFVAQQIRHDEPVQVLAAARRVVLAGAGRELLADVVQLGGEVEAQTQILDDLLVALADRLEHRIGGLPGHATLVAGVEHVRHLDVVRAALARRRRHHVTPLGVGLDDRLHLPQLRCVGHAGPTILTGLQSHFSLGPSEFSFPPGKARGF